MSGVTGLTAREAALRALEAYRRNGVWPERSLSGKLKMDAREMALAWRILNGVIQNLILLDYYVAQFSDFRKIEPQVLDILRISVYQIVFMDIPNSAAVNEGVRLAKKRANPRASGFVNAVLRKISQAGVDGLPKISADTEIKRLSIEYSHPEWLVENFCKTLGTQDAELLLRKNNADDTPVTVQVNTLAVDTETVLYELTDNGFDAVRHDWLKDCIRIRGGGNIEKVNAFRQGYIYVQDAAARFSVAAAGIKPGDFIIDACAAPGGKSFAAAIAAGDTGNIYACDISEGKLAHITDGAARLGIKSVKTRVLDASEYNEEFCKAADVVIADVPCSGFGVIRKKPEIRYKKPEDIEGLPLIQSRILDNLSKYVKPGGVLIYSTCTVLEQENGEVVKKFLDGNREFLPEKFTLPGIGCAANGANTLWPHLHDTDGFYISKLRRRNNEERH